jgi:hypothetical protein
VSRREAPPLILSLAPPDSYAALARITLSRAGYSIVSAERWAEMSARVERDRGELVDLDPGRPRDRVALRDHGDLERGARNRLWRNRGPLVRAGEQKTQHGGLAARAAISRDDRGRARAASRP